MEATFRDKVGFLLDSLLSHEITKGKFIDILTQITVVPTKESTEWLEMNLRENAQFVDKIGVNWHLGSKRPTTFNSSLEAYQSAMKYDVVFPGETSPRMLEAWEKIPLDRKPLSERSKKLLDEYMEKLMKEDQ